MTSCYSIPSRFLLTLAGIVLGLSCRADTPSAKSAENAGEPTKPAQSEWLTDYPAALKRAAAEHKPVLLDFTGSDWCIWCHRLDGEIFAKAPFQDYARENLILVVLDFPRRHELPAELKAQNDQLSEKYGIDGYPTVILVDSSGRELGRTGYMQGGPKTFVRELKRIIEKKS